MSNSAICTDPEGLAAWTVCHLVCLMVPMLFCCESLSCATYIASCKELQSNVLCQVLIFGKPGPMHALLIFQPSLKVPLDCRHSISSIVHPK